MKLNIGLIALIVCLLTGRAMAIADDATPTAPQTCVDVQIGQDRSSYLNCLNDKIKRQVDQEQNRAAALSAPYSAGSPAYQVGGYNRNGAQEQMGDASGASSHPQRPVRIFVSPLLSH